MPSPMLESDPDSTKDVGTPAKKRRASKGERKKRTRDRLALEKQAVCPARTPEPCPFPSLSHLSKPPMEGSRDYTWGQLLECLDKHIANFRVWESLEPRAGVSIVSMDEGRNTIMAKIQDRVCDFISFPS